jgi:hypothetical protein
MMDLMYFGYGYGSDEPSARQNKIDFAKEVREKFPNVELRNADDEIKGYSYEVHLDDKETEDYNAFLFGKGWFEMSLTMQIDMMSKERKEDIIRWLDLAKVQYPEAFKSTSKTATTE